MQKTEVMAPLRWNQSATGSYSGLSTEQAASISTKIATTQRDTMKYSSALSRVVTSMSTVCPPNALVKGAHNETEQCTDT